MGLLGLEEEEKAVHSSICYAFPMRRGTLVLGLLLALTACSVTVTVSLPDQTLDLPGLTDTGGKVVYPKDGLSFIPPPVDVVQGIRVEGSSRPPSP